MACIKLPSTELVQKIYRLTNDSSVTVIGIENGNNLDIHIKLINNVTDQEMCLTEDLLMEVARQGRKLWCMNVTYPCVKVFNRISVHEESGIVKIKFNKKRITLTWQALFNLDCLMDDILRCLKQIEIQHFLREFERKPPLETTV